MPVNELEEHPYLNYYKKLGPVPSDYYKGIIIGSFPIYAITNTVDEKLQVIKQRFTDEASMRFFYGSKKSDLWKYVGLALSANDPRKYNGNFLAPEIAVDQCKKLLFDHQLLISDSLWRTNRAGQKSEDVNLMLASDTAWVANGISVNNDLATLLAENKGLKNIYFTSTEMNTKGPFYWFKQIFAGRILVTDVFNVERRAWSAKANITFAEDDVRTYHLFFLPTPKPRGIHWAERRTLMFEKYIKNVDPEFYNSIVSLSKNELSLIQNQNLSQLRILMLTACYQQAIVYGNLQFDGSNPII